MSASATTIDLLNLIRKSGLMEVAEITAYLATVSNADQLTSQELAARMVLDGKLTTFQMHHLLKGRYKHFFIGKFKVLQALGSGGMSQVYLCEHTVMKHRVALKLLPLKDSSDTGSISRFLREARAAAAVNHLNVVRAHDVDKAEGKIYYLVMDYVDGVNLHDLVKRIGPLPPEQAANYIAQAALGLQEIASKGLTHHDLKPSNLMLDREGVVRILDLGLARFKGDAGDSVTPAGTVFGTADYLSPEQALQLPDVDQRADIYSLGATLYFLLAGTAPFESASVTQKLLAHQMREAEAIPEIPTELMKVIGRMMAKQPEDRFQNAIDVVEALSPWASLPLPMPPEEFFPSPSNSGPLTNGPRTSSPSTTGSNKTLTGSRGKMSRRVTGPSSDILRTGVYARRENEPALESKSQRTLLIGAIVTVVIAAIAAVLIFVV